MKHKIIDNQSIAETSSFFALLIWGVFLVPGQAGIRVDQSDPQFFKNVTRELDIMRAGKRGIVGKTMMERMDLAVATTTIKPITRDENTWHPNDTRGIRTHVVAVDTLIRDAARTVPTDAILYLNPNHIDPKLSSFKLGAFVHNLALAMDLNIGEFSGDFQERERRAMFFRNAWRDSMDLPLFEMSERVPTTEYQMAKDSGLISEEYAIFFPILDVDELKEEINSDNPASDEKTTTNLPVKP